MEELNLFKTIISRAKNVNSLPTLSDIYKELENLEKMNICDYYVETDCISDDWDETNITLVDGSQIELIYGKSCILHSYGDLEKYYSYKISDSLYVCANCLTILVEHKDLCEKYYDYYFEDLLFPKKWDKNSVISWIRKSEKRQNEYYSKRYSYQNYYDFEDYDDYEDYFDIEEFTRFQKEENKVQEERTNIWKQEDCIKLYNKIINYVQNPSTLTKTQLNQAKDMSISAIQKNKEPDYERFKKRVEEDREKALKKKKRKSKKIYNQNQATL